MENVSKGRVLLVILGIGVVILALTSMTTIESGRAGVLYEKFGGGVVTEEPPLGEGFHWVAPWNTIFKYEVRQQSIDQKMSVLSSNGLQIKLDASVWFYPVYENLGKLHQEKGESYIQRLILPSIRSAARAVVGRYDPEQLYASKRETIQNEILAEMRNILENQYIDIKRVLVRDITLPAKIKQAIERKLNQEQQSLEYEFKLTKAEKEAKRQKIEAEGKARANRILSKSLTDDILTEKGIEATIKLSNSKNSKVIVIGSGKDGMPIILGDQ